MVPVRNVVAHVTSGKGSRRESTQAAAGVSAALRTGIRLATATARAATTRRGAMSDMGVTDRGEVDGEVARRPSGRAPVNRPPGSAA